MLKYFICDFTKKPISFDACIRCALEGRNVCNMDFGILCAIKKQAISNLERNEWVRDRILKATKMLKKVEANERFQKAHPKVLESLKQILKPRYSISKINNPCMRREILQAKFDYGSNPRKLWWLLRGTLIHKIMEEVEAENLVKEKYLRLDRGEWILSCRIDQVNTVAKVLTDYKTTNSMQATFKGGFRPRPNDYYQVNIGRLVWNENYPETPVQRLQITYFDLSFHNTIRCQLATRPTLIKYINSKIKILRPMFEKGYLPPRVEKYPTYWCCRGYCPVSDLCKAFEGDSYLPYLKKEKE